MLNGADIQTMYTSNDDKTKDYTTGDIVLSNPQRKRFRKVEFTGSGQDNAELFLDGISTSTKAIDMDTTLNARQMKTPANNRARRINVNVSGQGEVTEIRAEVFKLTE